MHRFLFWRVTVGSGGHGIERKEATWKGGIAALEGKDAIWKGGIAALEGKDAIWKGRML
jgi:hypothetical protein